mgnify:CR=1 FL=1
MHELPGLSYREFLEFKKIGKWDPIPIEKILSPDRLWKEQFNIGFKPLEHFSEYLKMGYYPFSFEDPQGFNIRLQQLIRTIVEFDMAELKDFEVQSWQAIFVPAGTPTPVVSRLHDVIVRNAPSDHVLGPTWKPRRAAAAAPVTAARQQPLHHRTSD